jgi:hypothetical protein
MFMAFNGSEGKTDFFHELIDRGWIVVDIEVKAPHGSDEKSIGFARTGAHIDKKAE